MSLGDMNIGGIWRAIGGDGSPELITRVRNPRIQSYINQMISGLGGTQRFNEAAVNDYISRYMANEPLARRTTAEETGAIDQFYSGQLARELAALRAKRAAAVTGAADVAAKQAIRSGNLSNLTTPGSGSSYSKRLMMANLTPIRTAAALDDVNQERSDLDYLTANKINLASRRLDAANRLAAYGLLPAQVRTDLYRQNLGLIGGLEGIDQANKWQGVKQNTNRAADILDAINVGYNQSTGSALNMLNTGGQQAQQGLSAYAALRGVGGGGGGGGV